MRAIQLERTFAWLAIGAIAVTHLRMHWGYTIDDAYITYRYAASFAQGLGLTYNAGEWTKGYSNTLYTLLMVIPEYLNLNTNMFSKALGSCALGLSIWSAFRIGQQSLPREEFRWLAPALVASCASLTLWSVAGLETGLLAALALTAVSLRLREQASGRWPWSCLVVSAVVLSRPEGIVLYCALAAHSLGLAVLRRQLSAHDVVWLAVPLTVYAGELAISQMVYGRPFPQTFYAKVQQPGGLAARLAAFKEPRGYEYVAGMLTHNLGWPPFVGLSVFALWGKATRRAGWALALCVLAHFTYAVLVKSSSTAFEGPAFRYGTPALPLLLTLISLGFWEVVRALNDLALRSRLFVNPAAKAAFAGLVGLLFLWGATTYARASYEFSDYLTKHRVVEARFRLSMGEIADRALPAGHVVSSYDIGGVGYAAPAAILDTAGLIDPAVGTCVWRHSALRSACNKLATIAHPDLVFVSGSKERWLTGALRRSKGYLSGRLWKGMDVWVRKEHVLIPAPPVWARPLSSPSIRDQDVTAVGHTLPELAAPGTQLNGELFYRRGAAPPGRLKRSIVLRPPKGKPTSYPIDNLWRVLPMNTWNPNEVLVDHVQFKAPSRPGAYRMELHLKGQPPVEVATLHVLASAEDRRARADAEEPTLAEVLSSRARLEKQRRRAVSLRTQRAVAIYQDAAVAEAERLVLTTNKMAWPMRAVAIHDAQVLLRRARFETSPVGHRLRDALNRLGEQRLALEQEVVPELL